MPTNSPCGSNLGTMSLSPRVPELSALDVLLSVGRLGSMGAAGREHGLSQQAVSARVRSVERQLGIKVFDRAATGVRPTAEGGLILEWASHILVSAEEMASGVAALRGERDAAVTVAASMTIAEYLVPGWTVAMRHKFPNVVASVSLHNSSDVSAQVQARPGRYRICRRAGCAVGARVVRSSA